MKGLPCPDILFLQPRALALRPVPLGPAHRPPLGTEGKDAAAAG